MVYLTCRAGVTVFIGRIRFMDCGIMGTTARDALYDYNPITTVAAFTINYSSELGNLRVIYVAWVTIRKCKSKSKKKVSDILKLRIH